MLKFSFLSLCASGVAMAAGIAIFFLGVIYVDNIGTVANESLQMAVLLSSGMLTMLGVAGWVIVTPASVYAVEVRESGRYGFTDHWTGRFFAWRCRGEDGQVTFCRMWSELSLMFGVFFLAIGAVTLTLMVAFMAGDASTHISVAVAEESWYSDVLPYLFSLVFVGVPVAFITYIGMKLKGTWLDLWHKQLVCPLIEAD